MIDSGNTKNVHLFHAAKVPFLKDFSVKGKLNSLSLVSLGLNLLALEYRECICPNSLILADL